MRGNQQRLALTDQSLEVWQIKKAGGNEPPPGGGGAGKHLRDTSCCHGGLHVANWMWTIRMIGSGWCFLPLAVN